MPHIAGFRLGVYVFKDAEIIDFSAPYGVFSVARRFDPELDACLIADAARPVQAQATAKSTTQSSERPVNVIPQFARAEDSASLRQFS